MKTLLKLILLVSLSGPLSWTSAQTFDLLSAGSNNRIAQTPNFTVSKSAINIFSGSSITNPMSTINGDTMLVARIPQSATLVNDQKINLTAFALDQNYPNPFNATTVIRYLLPEQASVTIKVFDLTGREIATIVDGIKTEGMHSVGFGSTQLSTGTYFYRMTAQTLNGKTTVETKKMIVMK